MPISLEWLAAISDEIEKAYEETISFNAEDQLRGLRRLASLKAKLKEGLVSEQMLRELGEE